MASRAWSLQLVAYTPALLRPSARAFPHRSETQVLALVTLPP